MKRKLIDFDVYKKIKNESLSQAEIELVEASDLLAKALNVNSLQLDCYGDSDVTYETADHSFVHATYRLTENSIILENIEELIVDESSAKKESRELLGSMVEEILGNNDTKAQQIFSQYLGLPNVRKKLMEANAPEFWVEKPGVKAKKSRGTQSPSEVQKRVTAKKKSQAQLSDSEKRFAKQRRKSLKAQLGDGVRIHARFKKEPKHEVKVPDKKLKEWFKLTENVANYLDYQELGPAMRQSEVRRDEKGNVVAIRIPTSHVRNEGKILTMNYKHMLDTELKCLRGKMKTVHEDASFCHAMSDLRKTHTLSDETAMQQILEAIVTRWPDLIYLTHGELAARIGAALDTFGEANYDDEMCNYLAEGILSTAVNAFGERANKIARLAGVQLDKEHTYESFTNLTNKFYASIDEATKIEMDVFAELYNALVEVHTAARKEGNEALCGEASDHLRELYAILNQETEPTLEIAADAAGWLAGLVEANVPGASEDWAVSNSVHQTINGDHPRMSWAANQHGAVASNHNGDIKGTPVSDGKSYKNGLEDEMKNNSWGNWSSKDVWPDLDNPAVLKPFGDYTMKGEKGADKDGESDWSRWQSDSTFPNLQNPNVLDSPWSPSKYKMKSDNLVVEK